MNYESYNIPTAQAMFVSPHVEIIKYDKGIINQQIELCSRTCYKSEDKITPESADKLIARLAAHDHSAMFEHASITVKFFTDRGISHEIVRHREASYAQESTRYVKYGDKLQIVPPILPAGTSPELEGKVLKSMMINAIQAKLGYDNLIDLGMSAEVARDVLPTFTKTEIVVTANIREWRHIFNLRCAPDAHPKIRQVMLPLLIHFSDDMPLLFGDLVDKYVGEPRNAHIINDNFVEVFYHDEWARFSVH